VIALTILIPTQIQQARLAPTFGAIVEITDSYWRLSRCERVSTNGAGMTSAKGAG
jgi:hypothetical protein